MQLREQRLLTQVYRVGFVIIGVSDQVSCFIVLSERGVLDILLHLEIHSAHNRNRSKINLYKGSEEEEKLN
jgi:hypothetical protein